MARKAKGGEFVEKAKALLSSATSVIEVKQAQAVLFPLIHNISLKQTAEMVGLSLRWTSNLRSQFIKTSGVAKTETRGGRYYQLMSEQEEKDFLAPFIEKASRGGIMVVTEIREALETHLNKTVSLTSVYNILHRNDWRKVVPDKQHPGSSPEIREDWKKNSRNG